MAATATTPPSQVMHPRAAAFTVEARGIERRIGLLFAITGLALVLVMGVLGLVMRLTQATVIGLSPGSGMCCTQPSRCGRAGCSRATY
jgi:hypothetical protein